MTSIEIAADEIHIWDSPLSVGDDDFARIAEVLSPDESAYAEAFHDVRARRQYVVSRGMLRRLLSRYVGMSAVDLKFETVGYGKPVLAGDRGVEFNLSHSGELVIFAVAAASRPVGVDLERLRPMPRAVELARRYLSPEENESIAAAPPELRDREFFSSWVRREAHAKAQGISVWHALESRHRSAIMVSSEREAYSVRLIDYMDEYVAAVAARGNDWRVVIRGGA